MTGIMTIFQLKQFMNIQDAKVLVTGGTTGIGYETAKLLRSQGAQVVICGRNEEKVQAVAAELDVYGIRADVSNETDIENMFAFALEKLGGLNVLINNAGLGFMAPLLKPPRKTLHGSGRPIPKAYSFVVK